jgi:hypothetical protein
LDDTMIHTDPAWLEAVTDISGVDLDKPRMMYQPTGELSGPEPQFKYALIVDYAKRYNLRTLVETGTCYGNACEVARRYFDQVYSIELSPLYYEYANSRFLGIPNVHLYQGDSGYILRNILSSTPNEPTLFWLDAHWSGGNTAKGKTDPPTKLEIDVIHELRPGSVILVDDMWELTSSWTERYNGGSKVSNEYGITRIVP